MGTAPEGTFCHIVTEVMLQNKVPPEWSKGRDNLHDRYRCSSFVTGTTPAHPEQWHSHLCHSQDGTVLHKVGCPLAFGGKPWAWSTDKTMDVCRTIARITGWKTCTICAPLR